MTGGYPSAQGLSSGAIRMSPGPEAILPSKLGQLLVPVAEIREWLRAHERRLFGRPGIATSMYLPVRQRDTRPDKVEMIELEAVAQKLASMGVDRVTLVEVLGSMRTALPLRNRDGLHKDEVRLQGRRANAGAAIPPGPNAHRAEAPTSATELKASTVAEFLALLRTLQHRSGANRSRLAGRSGIPKSSLYNLLDRNRTVLPQNSDQVRRFVKACGLDEHAVTQVMRVWADLYDQGRESSAAPPVTAEVDTSGEKDSTQTSTPVPAAAWEPQVVNIEVVPSRSARQSRRVGMVAGAVLVAAAVVIVHLVVDDRGRIAACVAIATAGLVVAWVAVLTWFSRRENGEERRRGVEEVSVPLETARSSLREHRDQHRGGLDHHGRAHPGSVLDPPEARTPD
ncbi:helix-turn-helix transcriptional regulator [Crossiella sp. CA-258035]|uniref:helix-turn-helix domain-containing protein n=1 Tax=Crossiella sp. CA-258035 TaxID=2981138 RepID=UPI0024BCE1A2|nr:helix-turn-helix transcriptional regulator [Crossiella sp. CA-258035]WHT21875.1 helix-turn-helix transcriptional regulator [Crossiella sp. CA-258035]